VTIGRMAGAAELYTHPEFLPPDRLEAITAHLYTAAGEPAAVQAVPGARLAVNDEVRRAWEIELPGDLHDELVTRMQAEHAALETFFTTPLEPCAAVATLRYPPGAYYRTHRDVAARPDPSGMHRRAVSLVLFLNSARPADNAAFSGGALRLYGIDGNPDGWRDVVPTAGMFVAFRSTVLHEVLPVEAGTRLSVVTWLLGR
jgi:predicted 2-oxoglutarate/Fe(II)-dependent dioxygenase YbiX